MILFKIWERKLFFNTLKLLLFFFVAIFLVTIVVDFSIHSAKLFAHSKMSFSIIAQYYLNLLIIQLNLFLSLTFMLATIKILSDMNIHHELTALRIASISAKKLSRPFILIAIILVIIFYLNYQYLYPKVLNFKDNFKEKFLKKTKYKKKITPNVFYLDDNTKLVYQKYNNIKKELFDVYFIKSNSEIWHAKYLYLNQDYAVGHFVDLLKRKNNYFEKDQSFETYKFKKIKLDKNTYIFEPLENRSISILYKQSLSNSICQKEKTELLSYLNYKLAMPITPLLIIIAIFPYLITFSRNISIFFICSFSICGFVIFHTIMDSVLILAENSNITPYLIIWFPIILFSSIFGKKYSTI